MAFYNNQPNYSTGYYPDYNNQRSYCMNQNYNRSPAMLPGKFIRNEQDIRPNDIPGDGSVAFFPEENYNYIVAKGWNTNGDRMDTVRYVPEQRDNKEPQMSQEMQLLQDTMQRLERIESMLVASGLFMEEKVETKEEREKKA